MDNKRSSALERIAAETIEWVEFSESGRWQKLKGLIESEVIVPAKDAFHNTEIDKLTDEQILRHTLTQRAVVRAAYKIIDLVEGNVMKNRQAQKELEGIEKHRAGNKPITHKKGE